MLDRIARLTWRRPRLVLALAGVFVCVAGGFGYNVEHRLKAAGFTDSASESERAISLLRSELGYDATPAIVALVRNRDASRLDIAKPAVRREVNRIAAELRRTRHVGHVTNPLAAGAQGRALAEGDGRSLVVAANLSIQDIESDGGEAALDARRRIGRSPLDVRLGGFAVSFKEVNDQTRADLTKAELIAFPILTVLLLLVFRGVIAAAIPLLLGVLSTVGTLIMLRVMSGFVDTSLFALNIATALSLGLAVDYALLLVSRYREELDRAGGPTEEAHRRTVRTAGRTALFSGFTVAVALAPLMTMPQRFLYSVGAAGAAVGLLSALMAVLVVPALLALLGPRINALAIRRPGSRGTRPALSAASGGWYRLAKGAMRRPIVVAVGCTALLLAAASPLLSTELTGPSSQAVPPGQPSYFVNAYLQQHYSQGVAFPITVSVRTRSPGGSQGTGDGASPAQLAFLRRRLARLDGIAGATPFRRASPRLAVANFTPAGEALDGRAQDAVREMRRQPVPGGGSILVSGNTARFIDEKQSLTEHLPLVAAIIAGTTLALLFALTGSIVLPIKTLLMNALTLAASLGVIVFAFQDGHLDGLFDYSGPAAIEVTSLAFLFAVTFGLSTDYAVLVMARIKEQHDAGASNEEAIALGIGATGRVITAAAAAIAIVFLAFSVSAVFIMKQIALGEAFAVLVDATLVRALLVPSLMRLLGEWNWWAPRRLARLQARFGISDG